VDVLGASCMPDPEPSSEGDVVMTHARPLAQPRRLALSLLSVFAFATVAPAAAFAQSPVPSGEAPAAKVAVSPLCDPENAPLVAGCLAGARPVEPDPSLQDPQPVPFDHVTVGPDGMTLTVYFWMGAEPCNGLHSVEATPIDGGIDLTILLGAPEDVASMTCIAIAELRSTVITLEQPLIVNGTAA
jgi:hypothetical protein